jgi:splicing factor 3B subunit 1
MENSGKQRKRNRWDQPQPEDAAAASEVFTANDSALSSQTAPTKRVRTEEDNENDQLPLVEDGRASRRRRNRWGGNITNEPVTGKSEWDDDEDGTETDVEVSVGGGHAQKLQSTSEFEVDETPRRRANRWDQTPVDASTSGMVAATPKQRSRWDETPQVASGGAAFQAGSETPTIGLNASMETPVGASGMETPLQPQQPLHPSMMTPENLSAMRSERELEARNRPWTDEELDAMFPDGYKIVDPPASYVPIMTPSRKLLSTPTPMNANSLSSADGSGPQMYEMPSSGEGSVGGAGTGLNMPANMGDLPELKPEDYQFFGRLLKEVNEDEITLEEAKERKIARLLLKVKNGTPPQRKASLRQLTDKARDFGAGPLFNQILPLLMSPTLEDQERHLLVKVIDRILYRLDELVRPYVHKILVVIEPLLIDEDYYARVEGREIISNLSKAAGLATMIAAMRPDIDNVDEYVRNTTARAFSVVASALGIPVIVPFLKAVCQSKKSWQARHTGIKIVQQIAILVGCAVLPHLKALVTIIQHGLVDENQKVRTICALALSGLAEAAAPFGIESFDSVLKPLWKGVRTHRGKVLAAFLKAIGYIIPLMDAMYANYYTREVMVILIREFATPDEEMKKIVLKVVKQCVSTDGVEGSYIKEEILPPFFKHFWVRRMALDRRNYRQLVETTVEISSKVGCVAVVEKIVDDLKDESEAYRRMVTETIGLVIQKLGVSEIEADLEERLVDGMVFAFQEQTSDDSNVMLNGVGTLVTALGDRAKPYLPQICGTIKWRLNNKSAQIRQQAADLISKVAPVLQQCEEEQLMAHLGTVLYEYLGEEYPEVLGSILAAMKAIVNVIGMDKMTPPIKDLLPRLTPILRNRHEKVQENSIDLVGRIADRGAEYVPAREWMRICFELLEMLKAHKKGIRRATVNTFGYIAKAIGPSDVLATLLNNLKVQERQNRVCTTVAIAIVAESCAPFTVIPALMNEYKVPDLNIQNGVLKSMSFMFEYIGEMGKDYIYSVVPLLEDALMDRDLVHRQTAASTVSHLALGVPGLGCEDALLHLLNYVWPNIFETSPHVINAVMTAVEGCRVAVGPGVILNYALQGLFHPARKVRETYWKIYNTLYIANQDALVAYYPSLNLLSKESQENPMYTRSELDLML